MRTRERSVEQTITRLQLATRSGVNTALLITGDPIGETKQTCTHAHKVLPVLPETSLTIAVAVDLYQPNWGRWKHKVDAIREGIVDAVFTQPIFDSSVFQDIEERTHHLLSRENIYAGIAWMGTERSRKYWQEKNGVPPDHLPRGNSAAEISRNSLMQTAEVLRTAKQEGYSVYIMPMQGTRAELERIFSMAENIME